ncbi:hypothetical protein PGT21_000078 [Puccinia graminis f. sp. tritici]|uniref:Uncharacterized protein n=1 Tax=Puccinia graminis f. sp. tritici TaxID=56615 RepID=A0A5B0NH51_PUCGR|nr:hypothetical protein PGT21_000078 [Puccinia graminis f. sp. tritici]
MTVGVGPRRKEHGCDDPTVHADEVYMWRADDSVIPTVGRPTEPRRPAVNNLTTGGYPEELKVLWWCNYTAGRIEKSRSATKAQPEFADTMAPRTPVKYHGFAPEAGRLKSIFRGDSRFQMVPRAEPGRPGG